MRKYYVTVGKKVKVINGEKRKKINKKKIKGKAKTHHGITRKNLED